MASLNTRSMNPFIAIAAAIILLGIALYLILIGSFKPLEPQIVTLAEPIRLLGLEIRTNDKDIYKDVGRVASSFNEIKKKSPLPYPKQPWASINISRDYDPESKAFTYMVGDHVEKIDSIPEGLTAFEIPVMTFAVFPVRPKSRFAWGITMGRMKRYIYTGWLPGSGYESTGILDDFELHDDRSLGRHPEIQLYVAVQKKGQGS
jgi:predicted transcriptional regulator YdeE